ncbi:helix-turn-helix domain-containing protein [Leifsonia shinshuensis]|uniref:TetR/AcrR family transcriptional regulator n=1 Tax=Leifsonia shinshuensis TaxID=150026 RepID=UPI00286669B3|nr:helix-turn-helix domain-containing protein [Leifsonia shinshuensis]MDR6972897.1 AcrR family transcriptional regulator [Leifsonia shinshuensis]
MGLREKKAARMREHMVDVAIDLFLRDGYDETTMEQIAERAEVGTTTLYRYFPSKDLLLLDRLTATFSFGAYLRARPEREPLGSAMAEALRAMAAETDNPKNRVAQLRRVVDDIPAVRAKVWVIFLEAREDLEEAIAQRMGLQVSDLSVRTTAGMMMDILQLVDDTRKRADPPKHSVDILDHILRELPHAHTVLPELS